MNKTHELKIMPKYFRAVREGTKLFEIRLNDRDYKVGDELVLKEYDNDYTGESVRVIITYLTTYAQRVGYVVLGIALREETAC